MEFLLLPLGVLIGSIIMQIIINVRSSSGLMVINEDDPDFATCGFKFYENIDKVKKKKYIVFKIKSQKPQK